MLPEIISKEPLGPAVRHGDDQWFDIVQWTHFAMLNAEELGVTKANVDEQMKSDNPDDQAPARHRRQLRRGARPDQGLGLSHHQAGRQLRRSVRAQRRPGLAAEDRARPQRAVDQGRPAIRAAGPLKPCSACHGRCALQRGSRSMADAVASGPVSCRQRPPKVAADLRSEGPQHRLSGRPLRGHRVPGLCARSTTRPTTSRAPRSPPASASGTTPPASTSARR